MKNDKNLTQYNAVVSPATVDEAEKGDYAQAGENGYQAAKGIAQIAAMAIGAGIGAKGGGGRASPASESAKGGDTMPTRVTNPKHHPRSTSPEPKNVNELFKNSIADEKGLRWTKGEDGTIHRFSQPSNGETHWNGSTAGLKPIRAEDIPKNIRKALGD